MVEEDFLKAIGAAPDDMTVRLVYADWLDERGDDRAEYVRLQAELRQTPYEDAGRLALARRVDELRVAFEPFWTARLDPPVWCVVGNVVDARPASQDGPRPRGTRLFRANAKILLATWNNWYAVRDPQRFDWESVQVVGQHRQSRQWIGCWIRMRNTCSWRVRLVHNPGATMRLREAGWSGFYLRPGDFECAPDQRDSQPAIARLLDALEEAWRREIASRS